MTIVKVSPKYQVLVPKSVRKTLGIEPGEQILVIQFEDRIELIPLRKVSEMRGFLKGIDTAIEREGDRV